MFYAHLEGRRTFIERSIERGLRGACYNIVYPPDLDDADVDDFDILINPQTFRLTFPSSARPPKVAQVLRAYGQLSALDLAEMDVAGRATALNDHGRSVCDDFLQAEEALHATAVISPYFFASSTRDPLLDISIFSSQYLEERTDKPVFCGIMLDSDVLSSESDFDELANRLTSPDSPSNLYLDLNLKSSPKKPLRNAKTLSVLKLLLDSLADAGKYTLLARCNIEGLLLKSATGLSAFSSSYYQSERQPLHDKLTQDYVAPPEKRRGPTPYVFAPKLMTDIPRPLVQRLIAEGDEKLFRCKWCGGCKSLLSDPELPGASRQAPVHYNACMTFLESELGAIKSFDARARLMLKWVEDAEQLVDDIGRTAVPAGTFTHLGQWRAWLRDIVSGDGGE